jgi:hypothetical protein
MTIDETVKDQIGHRVIPIMRNIKSVGIKAVVGDIGRFTGRIKPEGYAEVSLDDAVPSRTLFYILELQTEDPTTGQTLPQRMILNKSGETVDFYNDLAQKTLPKPYSFR